MRFKRYIDHPFEDTHRKRLALARRQRLDRERLPLFADEIAATQKDADTIMADRAASWECATARERRCRAKQWREARRRLAAYGGNERPALLAYWKRCKWPADPIYLLSMLRMFDNGQLDLDPPKPPPLRPFTLSKRSVRQ